MVTAESVEQVVEQLSRAELAKFRRWFAQFDADAWDAQIEADAVPGKLDVLAEEALAEYHSGEAREIRSISLRGASGNVLVRYPQTFSNQMIG